MVKKTAAGELTDRWLHSMMALYDMTGRGYGETLKRGFNPCVSVLSHRFDEAVDGKEKRSHFQ